MNKKRLINIIENLRIWQNRDNRAPHKPLLLLLMLSYVQQGKDRLIQFSDIEEKLISLLIEFGPYRKNHYPEEPFKRLPGDGIWEIRNKAGIVIEKTIGYTKTELRNKHIAGGFTSEVHDLIKSDANFLSQIANTLLSLNFPETIHQDIVDAIGINITENFQEKLIIQKKRKRDPAFRTKILEAYGYKCAICGFDVRIGHTPIALEAAHIKWHQAGGPDIENNGLALCSLHHKLLDRGALAISKNYKVIVSDKANGHAGFKEWLIDFENKKIKLPRKDIYIPDVSFTEWHIREVFQGSQS